MQFGGRSQWRRRGWLWWARKDLNLGPMDYESTALTAELRALQWVTDCGDFSVAVIVAGASLFGSFSTKGEPDSVFTHSLWRSPE